MTDYMETPIHITLTYRELSSLTLALSKAVEAYRALPNPWAPGRASDTRKLLDKLYDIERPVGRSVNSRYEGDAVRRECELTIRQLINQPY